MPGWSPYVLAALASAAVARLEPHAVTSLQVPGDFDAAVVITKDGDRLEVRAPTTARAGAELAVEVELLGDLVRLTENGVLPFEVPRIVGTAVAEPRCSPDAAQTPLGGQVVVQRPLPGKPISLSGLGINSRATTDLARAIAAIHRIPIGVIEQSGMPIYSADEYRQRHLTEIDEAAPSGKIPAELLKRWEEQLEDVAMWRFQPVVTHGDLDAELIYTEDGAVTAIAGWSHAKVADPADDLAWLAASVPEDVFGEILTKYNESRGGIVDPGLAARARLVSELALVRWLRHGLLNDLPDVVTDAVAMMADLAEQVRQ